MDRGIQMARLESGKKNISISTLSVICKYLGVSLSEFFKGID
jgi:transcriptional regulator with XRE-family HTH domain